MGELTIILCSIHMHMQYLHEAFLLGVGEGGGGKRPELSGLLALFCLPCPAPKCLPFFSFLFRWKQKPGVFLTHVFTRIEKLQNTMLEKKRNGRDKIWRG